MSIKLRFESKSFSGQVLLKDEALKPLLDLIAEHESDNPVPKVLIDPPAPVKEKPADQSPDHELVKAWLKGHSPSEILNQINWDTYPEKILLLGAYHESAIDPDPWRYADIQSRFDEAHVPGPSNFPRDIANAIKSGIVAPVTPRTYRVTKTGWAKIFDGIPATTLSRPKLETPNMFTTEGMPEL